MIYKKTQLEAKWFSELRRRLKIENYLGYYDNFQKDDLANLIDVRLHKEEALEMQKYKKTENVTNHLIDAISLLFQQEVMIAIEGKTEIDVKQTEDFNEILDSLLFNATMQDVNRKVNLSKDVGIIPQIREGKIFLDIVTSDQMIVKQKDDDPTQAEWIAYQVGINTNTTQFTKINIYHKWSSEGKFEIEVGDKGQIIKETQIDAPSYDGLIPLIMFRNYIPTKSFFKNFNSEIVEFNQNLNYNITRLEMMRDYNIPQRVDIGTDPDKIYPIGITMRMAFDQGLGDTKQESKYINPNFPITQESETNKEDKESFAISLGLGKDSVSGGEFTSGYELRLSRENILNKNRAERPFYRNSIKELCKIIMMTANQIDSHFKLDSKIKIDFGEIKYSDDPQQKAQTRSQEISNGTKSRIDFIMEDNPDLNRKDAGLKAKLIDKENSKSEIFKNIPGL